MPDNNYLPDGNTPKKIKIADIDISESLFKEIMDTKVEDMRMTYLSATAELGSPDAKRLIQNLGASDPTWFEAIPELEP